MNAPNDALSRAEQQALSAPFPIEDVARRHDAAMLFKGNDFAQTDIKDATLI
jgi:hypothetical protein